MPFHRDCAADKWDIGQINDSKSKIEFRLQPRISPELCVQEKHNANFAVPFDSSILLKINCSALAYAAW